MAVPYCMAGEYVVAAYTSVPNWESRTKAYNSSLLSPADKLVPMCKGFPDSQGVDTSQWRMWKNTSQWETFHSQATVQVLSSLDAHRGDFLSSDLMLP